LKIALVHDWLTGMRGGEKVLEQLCLMLPDADIFTLVYDRKSVSDVINKHGVKASFLQAIPGILKTYRNFLPLFPAAIESFNLSGYDLVISSSHCAAKGVRPGRNAEHICYCHTPMRYAWDQFENYFSPEHNGRLKYFLISSIMPGLRAWDVRSSARVGGFIANSAHVKARIKNYYNRESEVIYPPVDTDFYCRDTNVPRSDYYLMVSALAEYKKVDFAAAAFAKLKNEKLVIIGAGPGMKELRRIRTPNVELLGYRGNEEIRDHYRRAKAFIFPGEEDFGITVVEAMACGAPVLALNRGGALETVVPGMSGEFFDGTEGDFIKTLEKMKNTRYDVVKMREQALKFSKENFRENIAAYLRARGIVV
jgi:glycosyltransferase involved in cell wall biosynthesis